MREYYQTGEIEWLPDKLRWKGIKTIGMAINTMERGDVKSSEIRYFISSLPIDIQLFSDSVRGHWAIESMHWHLDVTFREDANKTLDKTAARNMNIIRKLSLSILKLLDVGKKCSLRRKRFITCSAGTAYLEKILNL